MSIFIKSVVFMLPFAAVFADTPPGISSETVLQEKCFCKYTDKYWDFLMKEFPEYATFTGYPGQNHRWTDYSEEAIADRKQWLLDFLDELFTIDPAQYDADGQLDYAILIRDLQEAREGMQFKSEYLQVTQVSGIHQEVEQIIGIMPTSTVEQYEDILVRLRHVPELFDQSIALLRKGLQDGITPPKVTLRNVPQQVLSILQDDPANSVLFQPFLHMPESFSDEEKQRISFEAIRLLSETVFPAYRNLYEYLNNVYIPGCRETIAWGDMPNGHEWYSYKARCSTTTNLTPKEIHELGLSEVKRIGIEMQNIVDALGFSGSIHDFMASISSNPRFFLDDKETLLNGYREIARKIESGLPFLFDRLPKLPFEIKPVPSYMEESAPTAYYMPGSFALGRPGYFYVNTYNLPGKPTWEMEVLTLHEAMPGHHLQTSIAQEIGDLAEFRKFSQYTAYVEGWGLYSESLGDELGLYQDPYSKFGQLTYEMWRAIRLVVDTGMHEFGWSRQQAIEFFKDNAGNKNEIEIINEVDRYLVWPGQALAYKIGELKIKELRSQAKERLGDKFDIRSFHDALLAQGAVPLDILEALIKQWIEAQ